MAALSLQAFAVGLIPLVLVKVLAPAYFAQEDTTTPFRIGVVSVLVNVALNLALFRIMGHVGLALATSAAGCVNAFLLWRGLYRAERCRPSRASALMLGRCLLAAAFMIGALIWLTPADSAWLASTILERALWLTTSVGAGGLVYLVVIWLTGGRISQLLHRA
jgi:putative peptidoglycan lipid II flippase